MTICRLAIIAALLVVSSQAQTLSSRTLLVYNTAVPESIEVANYYLSKRSIPSANRCPITVASQETVTLADYRSRIQAPVRACLNALGRENILYIVGAYGLPFSVLVDNRTFSLDSFLGDIWDQYSSNIYGDFPGAVHRYYADNQAEGQYYLPFQSLAEYRATPGSVLIYSVWRLDGPTAAISKALVDKALAAEAAGGPTGQGCFDWRLPLTNYPDQGYGNGDWDVFRASRNLRQAGITTLEDENGAEVTNCPNAAYYSGWYSLAYRDVFTWNIGAIGWHLDSASAIHLRRGPYWVPGALLKGITVTTGSVAEPFLQGMVRPSGAWRNLLEGANVGDAFLRNTRWLKWQVVYVGDPLYTPFRGGRPPFNSGAISDSLFISYPRSVVGGLQQGLGTITLSAPAPAGGRTFQLSSTYHGVAAVIPASVTVPAGQTRANFLIGTKLRTGYDLFEIIRATAGSVELRNSMAVATMLASVTTEKTTLKGGSVTTGKVSLNAKAGAGGVTVVLTSNHAALTVPGSVTIPQGGASTVFAISTSPVVAETEVKITATYQSTSKVATVKVTP